MEQKQGTLRIRHGRNAKWTQHIREARNRSVSTLSTLSPPRHSYPSHSIPSHVITPSDNIRLEEHTFQQVQVQVQISLFGNIYLTILPQRINLHKHKNYQCECTVNARADERYTSKTCIK